MMFSYSFKFLVTRKVNGRKQCGCDVNGMKLTGQMICTADKIVVFKRLTLVPCRCLCFW